jgi:hypothetical protein
MTELWLPEHLKPARKQIRVVFYYHRKFNRIVVGFPEQFPAPQGWEKIVCTSAAEVELWSKRLRLQEQCDEEMSDEQREAVEGPIRNYVRKELVSRMMNARNELNREFCRYALKRLDEQESRRKMKKIAFMHAEAHEDGH